jgi:NAD/NADP transhydrogenase beta subunit
MNVLLAEVNVPHDRLYDIDAINDEFAASFERMMANSAEKCQTCGQ